MPTKIAIALCLICLTGCIRREGRNTDCKWPEEPDAKALDLSRPADRAHLRSDMELGEELAIEYMDAHRGQGLRGCLISLSEKIAQSHHVTPDQVAGFFGQRSVGVDVAINTPYFVLYGLLAGVVARWLLRRYPPQDGMTVTALLMFLSSLVFGGGGLLLGQIWDGMTEGIRVDNGHMSYRLDRLPFVHHPLAMFLLCVAVFWVAAGVRYRMRGRDSGGAGTEVRHALFQ